MTTIYSLNTAILITIIRKLSVNDLFIVTLVCKLLRKICNEDLWRLACASKFTSILQEHGLNIDDAVTMDAIKCNPHWPDKYRSIQFEKLFETLVFPQEHNWINAVRYIAYCLCNIGYDQETRVNYGYMFESIAESEIQSNSILIGKFVGSKLEGLGIRVICNPFKLYIGNFVNGRHHGTGYFACNRMMYIGQFVNFLMEGFGQCVDNNGSYYHGDFVHNHPHGNGKHIGKIETYDGQWKSGKQYGFGSYSWSDGTKYIGEFKNNAVNGKGTYCSSGGTMYIGDFADNKMHGYGTITHLDGHMWSGNWVNDIPDNIQSCIHPDIANTLAGGKCTYILTENKKYYSQILHYYRNKKSKIGYICQYCYDHNHWSNYGFDITALNTGMELTPGVEICSCICSKK